MKQWKKAYNARKKAEIIQQTKLTFVNKKQKFIVSGIQGNPTIYKRKGLQRQVVVT